MHMAWLKSIAQNLEFPVALRADLAIDASAHHDVARCLAKQSPPAVRQSKTHRFFSAPIILWPVLSSKSRTSPQCRHKWLYFSCTAASKNSSLHPQQCQGRMRLLVCLRDEGLKTENSHSTMERAPPFPRHSGLPCSSCRARSGGGEEVEDAESFPGQGRRASSPRSAP